MRSCSRPLVTVIVPIYKVESYIRRCIDSILSQSYSDLEIILIDDGSPDECPAICDDYRLRDERIAVIHKENGGLSSARNAGISRANGEYLCFVDSDDYILPDMIEQLVLTARSSQVPISACSFTSDEGCLDVGITEQSRCFSALEAIREIVTDGIICTSAWAKLYERELFSEIRFPEGLYYEDYATTYKLFFRAGRVAFADTRKYFYTVNDSGITKSRYSSKHMDYFAVSDEIESFSAENCPELQKLVRFRGVDMAVSLFRKIALTPERGRFAEDRKTLVRRIRRDALGFLFSAYPARKKISALAISLCPDLTERLLAKG